MTNPAPGFTRHPDHTITLHHSGERVRVSINGVQLADSRNSVILRESGYPDVRYLPKADIRTDWLVHSGHSTRCPFKGEATYWNLDAPGDAVANVGWGYETPYDEMAEIAGHVAFHTDRVDVTVGGDDQSRKQAGPASATGGSSPRSRCQAPNAAGTSGR